ncbi:MAG: B12-binding domain-containing radical SAM protein [Clostridia bacterium]|nr:B12-binding domain-containing radical SAM protein [Clostridia bacterium]
MNVLLINPSIGYYNLTMVNPLGLLSIGSYLEQFGHKVRLYDRCVEKTKLKTVLSEFSPDIAGISVMSSRGLKDAIAISKELKQRGVPVVWGGQLPSLQLDLVIANDYVDIVSIGEGEETWKELLDRLSDGKDIADVLGIAYKKDGNVILNPDRPFTDLGILPDIDWSLVDPNKYMTQNFGCKKMLYLYSSKGCPGNCAFCSNVTFHKSTHRKRPNEIVIREIKYLIENYGMDGVFFSDELWCIKRSDLQDFCSRVKKEGLHFRWGINLRLGFFNEEDYRLMYQAGCRWIYFGIESGSKEMQRQVHKGINYDIIKPTLELLNQIGFTIVGSFIVGFPDETEDQLRDTAKLINEAPLSMSSIFHFTPLPGTELYQRLVDEEKLKEPQSLEELSRVVETETLGINYSRVPDKDLKVVKNWFIWKSFSKRTAITNGKPFEFARATIINGLSFISRKGFLNFIVNGFTALKEFLSTFFYSHMYPKIRAKYDLK